MQAQLQPQQEQPTAAVPIQAATDERARQQDSSALAGPGWSPWMGSAFSPAGGGGGGLLGALNPGPLSEDPSGQLSQLSARSVGSLPAFAMPGASMGGSAGSGLRSISAQLPRPPTEQPFAGFGAASAHLPYGHGAGGQSLLQKEDEELLDALCCPITQVCQQSCEGHQCAGL